MKKLTRTSTRYNLMVEIVPRVSAPCWVRPTAKPGELKTAADLACTEPHNPRYKARLHSHSSFTWAIKKPAGGASSSRQTSYLSEHLLEISKYIGSNSAPLLLCYFFFFQMITLP